MIVLDEPTSLMHHVTRTFFVERYLPALMEIVPNIYVITPNDEYIEGSNAWVMVKRDGVSTLVTNPSDLATLR
jgi:ABC-type siderophore export system fused ATPase/permease subunit